MHQLSYHSVAQAARVVNYFSLRFVMPGRRDGKTFGFVDLCFML